MKNEGGVDGEVNAFLEGSDCLKNIPVFYMTLAQLMSYNNTVMAANKAEMLVYTLVWLAIACIVYLFLARDSVKLTNKPRNPPTVQGDERLHSPGTRDMYDLRKDPKPEDVPRVKKVGELN